MRRTGWLGKIKMTKGCKETIVSRVTGRIQKYILSNKMNPGDTLPKEKEFASMMGVSRSAVREALICLRQIGLVESKKRKGATVKKVDPSIIFDACLPFLNKNPKDLKALHYFRYVIEAGATELAASRRTAEDIKNIQASIQKLGKSSISEVRHLTDQKFHLAILKAAKVDLLTNLSAVIIKFFCGEPECAHNRLLIRRVDREHKQILKAIINRNPEEARRLIKKHLRLFK